MTGGKKIGIACSVLLGLVIASIGGIYLAGLIYLLMNKQFPPQPEFSTWYAYWTHYGANPAVAKKLKISAGISAFLVYAVPLFLVLQGLRTRRELHGSARFASPEEVAKSQLNGSNGVVVGKHKGRYLIFEGQEFILLAAPTRSGKGVGFVVPNLLQYDGSCVNMDIKQENFDITAGFRANNGQEVYLFNPFAEDLRTHRYNMLEYISNDPKFRISDIQAIGFALYPDPANGKDPFFDQQARNLFMGLALYLCETPALPRTIGELLRQSSGKGQPIKEYLQGIINARNFVEEEQEEDVLDADGVPKFDKETGEIKRRKVKVLVPRLWSEGDEGEPPLSEACVDALNRFLQTSDNTLSSILASLNAPLSIWANPIVDAATSANDFDLRDVRKRKMTIYIGVTPDHLAEAALLINVFFTQLINLNTKELPKQNPELKYQCLLLMDEFTAIGKVGQIATAVSYMAGYNMRLAPVIQSMSQLAATYGQDVARNIATNHALQIVYAPREQKDANEYSEMLGFQTEKNKSRSRQLGKGSASESVSDQRRALLLPQELKEIGKWKEIILLENLKPVLCDKIKYFDDPVFTERIMPAPVVPKLNLDLHIAIVENRTRELTSGDVEGGVDLSLLALNLDLIPKLDGDQAASEEDVENVINGIFGALGLDDTTNTESDLEEVNGEEDLRNDEGTENAWEQADAAGELSEVAEGDLDDQAEPMDNIVSGTASEGLRGEENFVGTQILPGIDLAALEVDSLSLSVAAESSDTAVDLSVLEWDDEEPTHVNDEPPIDDVFDYSEDDDDRNVI